MAWCLVKTQGQLYLYLHGSKHRTFSKQIAEILFTSGLLFSYLVKTERNFHS